MQKSNLIVFDIDGTLTDTVLIHQKAFIQSLQQMGVEQMDTNFKTYKHHTDSFIAKEIFETYTNDHFDAEKIVQFEQFLLKNILAQGAFSEIAGAKKLITFLHQQTNFAVCFATGSLRQPAIYKMNHVGIPFNAQLLVAANDILERENIIQSAIDQAKKHYQVSAFNKIISVGDGLWDLKAAENLSLDFIGIGLKNKNVLLAHGAKVWLEDLTNAMPHFYSISPNEEA